MILNYMYLGVLMEELLVSERVGYFIALSALAMCSTARSSELIHRQVQISPNDIETFHLLIFEPVA